eukprot:TRINITY_DN19334_c0_g1_i1.p1 TRINITY_DN19334_c0_g1~~TRINITY_DN19334_c0_g1_i1.p1  ORF type:complete len:281 (+),score=69.35 TRINITY_DN19334_c0_g1_i1:19-861(+)
MKQFTDVFKRSGFLAVNKSKASLRQCFAMRVSSNSMVPYFSKNDIVLCVKADEYRYGDFVIATKPEIPYDYSILEFEDDNDVDDKAEEEAQKFNEEYQNNIKKENQNTIESGIILRKITGVPKDVVSSSVPNRPPFTIPQGHVWLSSEKISVQKEDSPERDGEDSSVFGPVPLNTTIAARVFAKLDFRRTPTNVPDVTKSDETVVAAADPQQPPPSVTKEIFTPMLIRLVNSEESVEEDEWMNLETILWPEGWRSSDTKELEKDAVLEEIDAEKEQKESD